MNRFIWTLAFILLSISSVYSQVVVEQVCSAKTQEVISISEEKDQGGNSIAAIQVLEDELETKLSDQCKALIYLNLGSLYHKYNKLVQAVKYLDEANKIFAAYEMYNEQITAINLISGSYYILGDHDISAKNTLTAIKIAKKHQLNERLDVLYNNLASSYGELQYNDSAIKYVQYSIELANENQNTSTLLHALSTKAETQLRSGEYTEAELQFEEVIELGRKEKILSSYLESNCLFGIAKAKFLNNDPISARDYGRKAFSLAIEDNHIKIAELSAKLLYEIWEKLDDSDSAYYYLTQYVMAQEKIKPNENLSQLNRFRMRKAELQILEKEQETEKQKYYTILGTISAALLLLLFIVIFLFYRNSNKLNHQLKEKNDLIHKANSQLANQRDELNNLNKVKDRVFSAVIHDFKTPMNTLESMLNMLIKKYMTPDEASENAKKLLLKLKKSRLAINSTIAWIKTQLEGYTAQEQEIELGNFISEIKSYHSSELQKKQIRLKTQIDKDLRFISDRELLFIILNNLISNAIKFSNDKSEIKITSQEEGGRLILKVEDKGVGMKKNELNRIFSLETLSKEGTAAETGSGLGLKISNELIANLGGEITAESDEESGSTFYVRIKLKKVDT
ncbi:tetratricopeptide repeat-containing sensor histidine kinase [Marivirga arenosa]|uniref:histidine kinase n=1 Tax=Marivirga arenosa TaxID=3059076 RepID=A0AA52EXU4_9BACT|nr:tetratricopeptide repeat-containing sensor histidine kinase [Marivirga sp. BKB1-2]WNB18620.1 tetratricopeptide repeat-containing sensor histidine kinase [Marivirga sp. BKB1-2]